MSWEPLVDKLSVAKLAGHTKTGSGSKLPVFSRTYPVQSDGTARANAFDDVRGLGRPRAIYESTTKG